MLLIWFKYKLRAFHFIYLAVTTPKFQRNASALIRLLLFNCKLIYVKFDIPKINFHIQTMFVQ